MTLRAYIEAELPSSLRRVPHELRARFAELCALRAAGHDVERVPAALRDAWCVLATTWTTLESIPIGAGSFGSAPAALERRLESMATGPTRVLDPWNEVEVCAMAAACCALRARLHPAPTHAVHAAAAEVGVEAAATALRDATSGAASSGPLDAASTPVFGRDRTPSAMDAQRQDLADLLTLAGLPPPIAAPRIEFLRARARSSAIRLPIA